MKYTKEQIIEAGKLGEISSIDVNHLVSLLDEVVEKKCKCVKFTHGKKFYTNGCKIHDENGNK